MTGFSKGLIAALLLVFLVACDTKSTDEPQTKLPWQVTTNSDGTTHVVGVDIGNATFKDLMFKTRLLAEPAVFETPKGKLSLEAYFGKKKFGLLEARLVAEIDADEAILKQMLEEKVGTRDSTPSGNWKYTLSIKNTKIANDLRVWRLIYLPTPDFDLKQMNFFGVPEEKLKVNDTAEYWLYPSKGMALLYDTAGKEIFYYASQQDFPRLKAALPKEVIMRIR